MKTFRFTLTGTTPFIMHADDVEHSDRMDAWKASVKSGANKVKSKAGDDRTPAFRWIGSLYRHEDQVVLPAECFIRTMIDAGKSFGDSTGKTKNTTLKRAVVTDLVLHEANMPLHVNGKPIDIKGIADLEREDNFEKHKSWADKRGFTLHVKRATIGASKHVRVRPMFQKWQVVGTLSSDHPDFATADSIASLLNVAGTRVGFGDWRPSSPKVPGPYGRFKATVEEI